MNKRNLTHRSLALFCLSVLLCSLLLSGCGQETIEGLPMPQGVDGLKVGKDTYVLGAYPSTVEGMGMLCRIPQGERMPVPLCGKPGCNHDDSACEGLYQTYLPEAHCTLDSNVGFFRDRLYALSLLPGQKVAVYSVDPETAERRQEMTLDPREVYAEELSGLYIHGAFHENSLILLYERTNMGGPIHRLVVVDLATEKQKELFREHFDEHLGEAYMTVLSRPMAVGTTLYLFEEGPGSLPASEEDATEKRFSKLDLKTGKVTQLLRENDLYTWRVEDETVFFSDQREYRFKEYNLATGELTTIPSEEEITGESVYLDDQIVRVANEFDFETQTNKRWYEFYSRDYAYLDKLECSDDLALFLSTEEALYFRDTEGLFYLDRSEIGSHDLKLQPLEK